MQTSWKIRSKGTVNWNKYQSKKLIEKQKPYLEYLIDPSFQGVNKLFVLAFQDNAVRKGRKKFFLATVTMKN